MLRVLAVQAGPARLLAELPLPLLPMDDPLRRVLRQDVADWPRWLLLPASLGLRRPLLLPAAARERLREVLAFEIERQTPFAAEEVLYDGRLLGTRDDGQLQVELVVLPLRQFQAASAGLGGLIDRLAGVDLLDAQGQPLGVNVLAPARRYRARSRDWLWSLGLAALAVLALAAAGWFIRQKMDGWAFVMTSVTIVFSMATIFMSLFPRVMVSSLGTDLSLTVYNTASSPYTLTVMSIVALIFVPVVLIYQGWSYWVFRRRVTTKTELEY